MTIYHGPLGQIPPTDTLHQMRYSLTAGTMPTVPTPVVLGVKWFTSFDTPTKDSKGRYWISRGGTVRGGHAICLKPPSVVDNDEWWASYDQGAEGACVGFAISRMMTLLNRRRYDGFRHYRESQKVDDWAGENYSGTSVRAGCDVARKQGMWRRLTGKTTGPFIQDGISENRWAGSIEEIAACLGPASDTLNRGYVQILNSWGKNYPHYVHMSLENLDNLVFLQGGEATVAIDRPNSVAVDLSIFRSLD